MAITGVTIPNIERQTLEMRPNNGNDAGVREVYKGDHMQIRLVALPPEGVIPMEKHVGEQFIRVESGSGVVTIEGDAHEVKGGDAVVVCSKQYHRIEAGKDGMRFYTIYAPPAH